MGHHSRFHTRRQWCVVSYSVKHKVHECITNLPLSSHIANAVCAATASVIISLGNARVVKAVLTERKQHETQAREHPLNIPKTCFLTLDDKYFIPLCITFFS